MAWSVAEHGSALVVFSNGFIVHITSNLQQSDIIDIVIDKSLEGKLLADIVDGTQTHNPKLWTNGFKYFRYFETYSVYLSRIASHSPRHSSIDFNFHSPACVSNGWAAAFAGPVQRDGQHRPIAGTQHSTPGEKSPPRFNQRQCIINLILPYHWIKNV